MSDDRVAEFVNSADMEEAVVEKAREVFPDAWDLAIQTEDEDLFRKVWDESLTLVIDDILTSLVQKGYIEVGGMTEQGEMSYQLSEQGRSYMEEKTNDASS